MVLGRPPRFVSELRLSKNHPAHLDSGRAEFLVPGMTFENIELKSQRRGFQVKSIDAGFQTIQDLTLFQSSSTVKIQLPNTVNDGLSDSPLELSATETGGLGSVIHSINRLLKSFEAVKIPCPWLNRLGGLLLFGPTGTGKSMLLQKIATCRWRKVFHINAAMMSKQTGQTSAQIIKIFEEARDAHRSLIVIDDLDILAPKRDWHGGQVSFTAALRSGFDLLAQPPAAQVLVVAATNRINEIDSCLRKPDCFEFEVEVPIPNALARTEIIKTIVGLSVSTKDVFLERVGERTHGFTGSDLNALIRLAGWESVYRRGYGSPGPERSPKPNGETDSAQNGEHIFIIDDYELTQEDIDKALLRIRPTALREIFLEVPKVRWTDIGGQEHVKQSLKEALEWQLKASAVKSMQPPASNVSQNPLRMQRLGIQPKKGLLLYGPPGCSKTLTAKALATESGFNFLAVKGAELLNMYVGESERALREVFSKARAASPSIVFFDEIDAIAASREATSNGGLNVLTTLLNEMDGIESLRGVTVLAATNKPEILDLALMRPGRLDTILYVGPPDLKARQEILKIRTNKMDIAEDVDIQRLAEEMDGYSGAEIVSICDTAGYRAFGLSEMNGIEEKITSEHFKYALSKVARQITPEVRQRYEEWNIGGTKHI